MRLHVAGLCMEPQAQCAYSGKVSRLIKMLSARGHTVVDWAARPDEWDPDRRFDPASEYWGAYNNRVIAELTEVIGPDDFIGIIAGRCQQAVKDAFPNHITAEIGVGYGGVLEPGFRVFESVAWQHCVYGSMTGGDAHRADGRFYDTVIPNYFDTSEFPAGSGGDGYAFVGRLTQRKGVSIATDVCRHLGAELVIAGEGDLTPEYGTCVGVVDPPKRAEIMGSAKACFVPTLYVEPFGGVAIEAMLCGTPVITTDFGAFPEYVIDGFNGYKCHTLREFVDAAKKVDKLDRAAIREWAQERYSMEAIAPQYERYFERLAGLRGLGWPDLS